MCRVTHALSLVGTAYTLLIESFDVDLAGKHLPHVIAAGISTVRNPS